MKIIICGGHLTPALAVIEELKNPRALRSHSGQATSHEPFDFAQDKPPTILFIGRKYPLEGESTVSAEYKIITQMGIPFVSLITGRLQRKFTFHTIPSLLKIPIGFFQALWWIRKFKPDVILSFGGYMAVPVVVTGWILRVPVVTHEQTVVSGLANKIITFFAQKICVSWSQSMDHFPKDKVVLTGNPLRREIFKVNKNTPYAIGHTPLPLIYITGGSLGSHAINEAVAECLPQLLEKYTVIHQCGDSEKYQDFEKLKVKSETLRRSLPRTKSMGSGRELKVDLKKRYFLTKYVGPDDIGWVLNNADLVVSRSGANTVTELAALGKPAIFIPIPWASNREQEKNAQLLVNAGIAIVLPQEKLSGLELIRQIDQMIENLAAIRENTKAAVKLIDLSAAQKIIGIINEIYTSRRKV